MAKQDWRGAGAAARQPRSRWTTEPRDRWKTISRLSLPVLVLAVAVAALIAILLYLSPPSIPQLVIVSTRHSSSILPPNDAAVGDASALRAHRGLFETPRGTDPAASAQQMRDLVGVISRSQPRPPFLTPWKDTVLVVYVNAIGVRWDSAPSTGDLSPTRAWLVPDQFDPDQSLESQLVSVRQVLKAVADARATHKLLVFDCQRPTVYPHVGSATQQFVDAARQDIEDTPAGERSGVSVLFSCGSGEASWPMRSGTESVFGHYFARGIAGDADTAAEIGNGDQQVTLSELSSYVEREVAARVARECLASQKPFLVQSGAATGITLTVLSERRGTPDASSSVAAALPTEWQPAWKRTLEISRRAMPATDWTPVQWSMVRHELLAAERSYRAGSGDEAAAALRRAEGALDSLAAADVSIRSRIAELPASCRDFLAKSCAQTTGPASSPSGAEAARLIVAQAADGNVTLSEADEALLTLNRASATPLPCAAQFTRLIAARSKSGGGPDADAIRQALLVRARAEAAAEPRHPLVGRWIRRSLETADAARRQSEDQLLLQGWAAVPLGPSSTPAADSGPLFDQVEARRELVTRAYRARDRMLADLPYWITFIARSSLHGHGVSADASSATDDPDARPYEGMSFPAIARQGTESLLEQLDGLHAALLVDPSGLDEAALDAHLEQVATWTAAAESQFDRMDRELVKYAGSLSDARIAFDTADTWARIDALLQLPFPMGAVTSDPVADAVDSAEVRSRLLSRVVASATADQTAPATTPSVTAGDGQVTTDQMFARLYSLPFRGAAESVGEPPVGDLLAGRLDRRLVREAALASSPDLDRESVLRADAAFRLLRHGRESDLSVASPAIRLRAEALAECLAAQAQRANLDLYAALDPGAKPYFAELANSLLEGAERLAGVNEFLTSGTPGAAPEAAGTETTGLRAMFAGVRLETERLVSLLERTQLTPEPAAIAFRGDSAEGVTVRIGTAQDFPGGTAALRVESASSAAAATNGAAQFLLPRPAASTESAGLAAYFRGHVFAGQLPLSVVGEFVGPSVTYRRQNDGLGRVRFRANRIEQSPVQLLFVLDCSGTMAQPDATGQPRMSSLRSVLTRFAKSIEGSQVRVGIRLFGHRVSDINAPEARTDTERILAIGAFGPGRLQDVLDRLVPTGHSPVFNALIEARRDFDGVGEGRRAIVLISDGADNWALAGQKPGLDELIESQRGAGIQIHAIGFNAAANADFAQLQRIATAGDQEGRCVSVEGADSLLWELAGLIGLPGFRILRDGEVVATRSQLSSPADSADLPAGVYDVEVVGPGGDVLTRRAIRVAPGDDHVLMYDAGQLRYAATPSQSARAFVPGADDQPDLLVMEAQPLDESLILDVGLDPKPGGQDLLPATIRAVALSQGVRGQEWLIRSLPPNAADRHYPAWRLALGEWPPAADQVEVVVAWKDLPAERTTVPLDWEQEFAARAVTDQVRLVRREREPIEIDGVPHVVVSLAFAATGNAASIEDWGVATSLPLVQARHAYDAAHGMYSVRLVVLPNTELDEITLFRTSAAPAARVARVLVPLAEKRINP